MSTVCENETQVLDTSLGHIEIRGAFAISDTCDFIVSQGRMRRNTMKFQRTIKQQSAQNFKFFLQSKLGPDHGKTVKQLYEIAERLRDIALKYCKDCGDELIELIGPSFTVEAHENFKVKFKSVCVEELSEIDLEVIAIMIREVCDLYPTLKGLENSRKDIEYRMKRAVRDLPVYDWWQSIKGCDELGLSIIVAETGNISRFGTVCKLRKWMGLAPMKGRACSSWRKNMKINDGEDKMTASDWVEAGYVPRKRSVMYNVGDPLIKQKRENSLYKRIYLDRKKLEFEKAVSEGLIPTCESKATQDGWNELGLGELTIVKVNKFDPKKHRTASHIHMRARRYMEQKILQDLWIEWNKEV